jgi:urate oxidase
MMVIRILETLDKLIVEENYLPQQSYNMDETSMFWKQMPERRFIHTEVKSMQGFKVCLSTLYDVRTMTKLHNDAFLRTCPRH